MKILIRLFTVVLIAGIFWIPAQVLAYDVLGNACPAGSDESTRAAACQDRTQTRQNNGIYGPNGIITKVTQLISIVVGIASIIMVMIGGFKYIIASGDPANLKSAKNTIMYAMIGLGIALFAQAIVVFVINRL